MWVGSWIRQLILVALGAMASASSLGCGFVATDKPLYGRQETVFDPQLLGIWAAPGSASQPGGILIIARGEGNRYRLSSSPMYSGNSSDRVEVDLVRLRKYEYLFFNMPEYPGTVLFPAYRVHVAGREMRLSLLNQPQFVKQLKDHPGMLTYTEQTEDLLRPATTQSSATRPVAASQPTTWPAIDNVVLTDEPEKIRKLLIEHQDDPNWFAEVLVLHRMTPAVRR
jgi:hypothetical protein